MFLKLKIWLVYKNDMYQEELRDVRRTNGKYFPVTGWPCWELRGSYMWGQIFRRLRCPVCLSKWGLGILTWKPYSWSRIYKLSLCHMAENFPMKLHSKRRRVQESQDQERQKWGKKTYRGMLKVGMNGEDLWNVTERSKDTALFHRQILK